MRTFERREDPMRLMRRRLIILALLFFIAFATRGVWGVYQKERESRALRNDVELQLSQLKSRENDLRRDIASLKSDRGVESRLREEYELAKEGEGVIVIIEPDALAPESSYTPFKWLQSVLRWW